MPAPFRIVLRVVVGVMLSAGLAACSREEARFDATTDARLMALDGNWGLERAVDPPTAMEPVNIGSGAFGPDLAPLNDQWRSKLVAIREKEAFEGDLDNNQRRCIPNGMPYATRADRLNVWIRPGAIMVLAGNQDLRRIYVDGRQHTPEKDLALSYQGESIGTWEGDTLVVDTIGLKRSNEIATGVGNVKAHVVERWTWSGDSLTVDTMVEDPHAMTDPWTFSRIYTRRPSGAIGEQYCVQSLDRAFNPETGEQDFSFRNER